MRLKKINKDNETKKIKDNETKKNDDDDYTMISPDDEDTIVNKFEYFSKTMKLTPEELLCRLNKHVLNVDIHALNKKMSDIEHILQC